MSRKIKFRGRRTDTGEWVVGCLTLYSEVMSYITVDLLENETYQVIAKTVGQFIGLTDKEGKEIYEGDILKIGDESSSVDYVGSSFRVMRKQIIRDETRVSYVTLDVLNISTALVIGNIYQNPELAEARARI